MDHTLVQNKNKLVNEHFLQNLIFNGDIKTISDLDHKQNLMLLFFKIKWTILWRKINTHLEITIFNAI